MWMPDLGDRIAELGRIKLTLGFHDEWVLNVRFTAIDDAVYLSQKSREIAYVVGPYIHEETQSYASRLPIYPEYVTLLVDNYGSTIFSLMRPFYKRRSKVSNRIQSYLFSNYTQDLVALGRPGSSRAVTMPLSQAREQLVAGYLKSRKIKTGADAEIEEFLTLWETVDLSGPVVIQMHGSRMTLAQYLILEKWANKDDFIPLVISSSTHASWQNPKLTIFRDPLLVDEIIDLLCLVTGKNHQELKRTWSFWSASQSRYRPAGPENTASLSDTEKFVNFVRTFEEPAPDLNEIEASIPNRIVAPIMFREAETFIEIDHSQISSTNVNHILGGARALRNQIHEVMASGSVDNSVPGATATFTRLSTVLDRIQREKRADEADIIELGVEFSFLEAKIYDASDRIGVLSKGPILGLLGEVSKYLSRFEAWRTYRDETADDPEGLANQTVAEAALQLLQNAMCDGLLSPEAVERVRAATEDEDALASAAKREGATRSTESMGAALGRSALKIGRQGIEELGNEARKRTVDQLADTSEAFLRKNAQSFLQVATARGGQWLTMVLQHLLEQ